MEGVCWGRSCVGRESVIEVHGWVGFDWGPFWGGTGNGASAATFVGCAAGGGPDAAGVGGNVAVVPMSMGMLGWHAGMAG